MRNWVHLYSLSLQVSILIFSFATSVVTEMFYLKIKQILMVRLTTGFVSLSCKCRFHKKNWLLVGKSENTLRKTCSNLALNLARTFFHFHLSYSHLTQWYHAKICFNGPSTEWSCQLRVDKHVPYVCFIVTFISILYIVHNLVTVVFLVVVVLVWLNKKTFCKMWDDSECCCPRVGTLLGCFKFLLNKLWRKLGV